MALLMVTTMIGGVALLLWVSTALEARELGPLDVGGELTAASEASPPTAEEPCRVAEAA
jgi:hypothetical protein